MAEIKNYCLISIFLHSKKVSYSRNNDGKNCFPFKKHKQTFTNRNDMRMNMFTISSRQILNNFIKYYTVTIIIHLV